MINWEDSTDLISAVRKWDQIFTRGFSNMLEMWAEISAGRAIEKAPVGSGSGPGGHLANSITAGDVFPSDEGLAIEFGTPLHYAPVIELGRTPGSAMPPVDEIAWWVWQVRHRFPQVETEEDAERIAYPIARSIAKKGFRTAPDGPGQGWGMIAKGGAYGDSQLDGIIAHGKKWIEKEVARSLNG